MGDPAFDEDAARKRFLELYAQLFKYCPLPALETAQGVLAAELTLKPGGGVDKFFIEGHDQKIYENCLDKYLPFLEGFPNRSGKAQSIKLQLDVDQ